MKKKEKGDYYRHHPVLERPLEVIQQEKKEFEGYVQHHRFSIKVLKELQSGTVPTEVELNMK